MGRRPAETVTGEILIWFNLVVRAAAYAFIFYGTFAKDYVTAAYGFGWLVLMKLDTIERVFVVLSATARGKTDAASNATDPE